MKNLLFATALVFSSFAMAEGTATPAAPAPAAHEAVAPATEAAAPAATHEKKTASNKCEGKKGAALKKCQTKNKTM
jgi:hypothetical protein